ncbi:MAG: hypothetical protein JST63_15765 [Bacteroidetes bacterium]|nr:hypothetical protein [Bacteroidota bacterium]
MKSIINNKLVFLLGIPVLLFFLACSKNKDNTPGDNKYYIRFKVDGKEKLFTGNAGGGPKQQVASNGRFILSFTAAASANGINNEMLLLTVTNTTPVNSAGSYRNNPSSIFFNAQIIYNDEKAKSWTSVWMNLNNNLVDTHIEISEIDSEYAKGTFSSTLYDADNLTKSRKISDGEFFVKLY